MQYEDVVLLGVKGLVGMAYIKVLLENPGVKIGVLDLQRLAGDSDIGGQQGYAQDCYGDDDAESTGGGVAAWEALDTTAKGSYRNRLEVIAAEVKNARNAGDQTKVGALIKEAEFIQKALQQGSFKPKDPEIDKNRKRVAKTINYAIANIGKLEKLCGFNDKPMSRHLSRYIETGSFCSYTAGDDNLPSWRF
jgi:hypothetical protein